MTDFNAMTPLGKLLGNPEAAEVVYAALPEMRDSVDLELVQGLPLKFLALHTGLDEAWLDDIVAQLSGIGDPKPLEPPIVPPAQFESGEAAPASAPCRFESVAPRWGVFEVTLDGPAHDNPFTDVVLRANFTLGHRTVSVSGFYDGDGSYQIRFMPDAEGPWRFQTYSNARSMDGIEGSFSCTPPGPGQHGPVQVAGTHHFAYADGTPYRPVGTTCYAWIHQTEQLQRQTLETLAASPFNKVRMCIFPKSFVYNNNEPELFAFPRLDDGGFDTTRFNPEFFRRLEQRVTELGEMGIEADLILFHPYDRWGFAELSAAADDRYLRYIVSRLSAHANVWWSLANEYDLLWDKDEADWERFGTLIREQDPHGHLIGVHNCVEFYDHTRPWVTHCSIQRTDDYRTAENTTQWREKWQKPVVVDECCYEGDIEMTWGNISGEELTRRFWEATVRGGYATHGETLLDPSENLWWSHGGELRGQSPARIAFLRSILEEGPDALEPIRGIGNRGSYSAAGVPGEYYLVYLGIFRPRMLSFDLPPEESYCYEVIDTWNMTIDNAGTHRGPRRIDLPGRPAMAIRISRVDSPDGQEQ